MSNLFTHKSVQPGLFRWWLHYSGHRSFNVEVAWRNPHFGVSASICDEGLTIYLGLWVGLWFSFQSAWASRLYYKLCPAPHYGKREVSLRIHDGSAWWNLYMDGDSWSSRDPKWRRGSFNPVDFVFGRTKHFECVLSVHEASATLPEGLYDCTVTMKREWWQRPRAFWRTATVTRAHIDCPSGIPVPGKGENSWDCGDDAIYGRTAPADDLAGALKELAADVLKTRRRRGVPPNWTGSKTK